MGQSKAILRIENTTNETTLFVADLTTLKGVKTISKMVMQELIVEGDFTLLLSVLCRNQTQLSNIIIDN
jgi:hypothetical protein